MNIISLRPLKSVPANELATLQSAVFADYAESRPLAEVIAAESAARPNNSSPEVQSAFGLAAFRGEALIGWAHGYREGKNQFYMLNAGVASAERRKGVYSQLVSALLTHAKSQGYTSVRSPHTLKSRKTRKALTPWFTVRREILSTQSLCLTNQNHNAINFPWFPSCFLRILGAGTIRITSNRSRANESNRKR